MAKTKAIVMQGTVDDFAEKMKEVQKEKKSIEIRGAELKDLMFCNYNYKHTVAPNTTNSVSIKSEMPVHPDLVEAFKKLFPHLAVICEEVAPADIKNIDGIEAYDENKHEVGSLEYKISRFTVSSFKLDGNEDNLSVVLVGQKRLSTGECVKLETPKTKLDRDYAFVNELNIAIDDLVHEVEEYMKGKKAEEAQLDLFADNDNYAEEEL